MNAPSLLEVNGEPVIVFGLTSIVTRLDEDGWSPEEPGFGEAVVEVLRETKNRIPEDQQAGCVAAIARIYREHLSTKLESSDT
jgi:hypothetical protein